jgi:arginine decarboxylase
VPDADRPGEAPLADAVDAALAGGLAHYAPPGHKRHPRLVRDGPLARDITLLTGVEDQWASSSGLLRRAEAALARAWGGDFARLSVHGSTLANQAALLALARPGGSLVVSRAAHKSVLAGLVLSGLDPVWVVPEMHDERGIVLTQSAQRVAAALAAAERPCAVFVVEPSYAGVLSDVPALAGAAHDAGVPLVVDQAWAAHFGFHPALPPGALAQDADVLITSLHKTLAAFSQGAALVARTGERADAGRLATAFDGLATTSPSATIQASVDRARAQMQSEGRELLERALVLAAGLRAELAELPGVAVLDASWLRGAGVGGWDPLKLVLDVTASGCDGRELARALRREGVQLAMADPGHLVALLSIGDDEATHRRLVRSLRRALERGTAAPPPPLPPPRWDGRLPERAMTPREAFFLPSRTLSAARADGEISAETIASYPPGIAEVAPGERLDRELLDHLRELGGAGVRLVGCADQTLRTVRVVASP